jgi:hypothetical protein
MVVAPPHKIAGCCASTIIARSAGYRITLRSKSTFNRCAPSNDGVHYAEPIPSPIRENEPGRHRAEQTRASYGCSLLQMCSDAIRKGGAHAPPDFQTGMPSFLALSARLAEIPEPGKTMTPIGSTSRI